MRTRLVYSECWVLTTYFLERPYPCLLLHLEAIDTSTCDDEVSIWFGDLVSVLDISDFILNDERHCLSHLDSDICLEYGLENCMYGEGMQFVQVCLTVQKTVAQRQPRHACIYFYLTWYA